MTATATMKLEDLLPENPTFRLVKTGKEHRLRIPNLEDKVRLQRMMPEMNAKDVFKNRNWSEICRLVYPLLEDKSDFIAREEDVIDQETGEKKGRALVLGYIVLQRSISTLHEAMAMLQAFNAASVASEPLMRDAIEEQVKKNLLEMGIGLQPTGENFLSSPPAAGASPQENSGASQLGS